MEYIAKEIKCATAESTQPTLTGFAETNGYCQIGVADDSTFGDSFFQYDLSGIPKGAVITSANLMLNVTHKNFYPKDITLYDIVNEWTEDSVSWNNKPTRGTARTSAFRVSAKGWLSKDITALVQEWVDGTFENNGINLYQGNNATRSDVKISNRYNAGGQDLATYIEINFISEQMHKISETRLREFGDEIRRITGKTNYMTVETMLTELKAIPVQTS